MKADKRKAFISFITAGDPSLKATEDLVLEFEKSGVDIIELGVPFSDPMADGPTIQASSQRALKHHVSLQNILDLVKRLRKKTDIPIALMTYYNPVFHYGEEKFVRQAVQSGVDGVIIPDLPPEEAQSLIKFARQYDLATIFFLAPTTRPHRIKKIVQASTGFIYYVSLTGVTGARTSIPADVTQKIKAAAQVTEKPICVGFGVSTVQQVKAMAKIADGVIVGSAIVNAISSTNKAQLTARVGRFVKDLVKGVR
ncbi:MAG: tryptophan synthase subunit alpha [Candidatus Omnitrophica bacterium]|nr:tryptophan synthase subunit alpha [Candidatus Omnitrophota bacterium]